MTSAFLRGLAAGLLVGAPIGPMALLAIRRTLAQGLRNGLASGLGIATADALYAAVAAFGLHAASSLLLAHARPVQAVGGALMVLIGLRGLRVAASGAEMRPGPGPGLFGAYGSTLLLTLANPPTIVSFLALMAGAGLVTAAASSAVALVAGVFAGSAAWWLLLTAGVAGAGGRLDAGGRRRVSRVAAGAMAALGMATLAATIPSCFLSR